MREFWANVWANGEGFHDVGYERPSREDCDLYLAARPNYRIHVRLKPEGAPRRYRDTLQRARWEFYSGFGWAPDHVARAVASYD